MRVYGSNVIWMVRVDVERAESRLGGILTICGRETNGAFPMVRPVDIDVLVLPRNALVRFRQGRGRYDDEGWNY